MKVLVLNALNTSKFDSELNNLLVNENMDISLYNVADLNVLPCRSCGTCGCKTPGVCIFNDDMPSVLRGYAHADMLLIVTPIRFGGYPSHLKKVIDRFMVVGEPLYTVKDGHLLHPMRYGSKKIVAIGIDEDINQISAVNNFKKLVKRNALNMHCDEKTYIVKKSDSIESEIAEIWDTVFKVGEINA